MRITFNSDSELTVNTTDRYVKNCGISRSKVISDLLDSISPALGYLVFQSSLKGEMEIKLLNLFVYELKEVEAKLAKDEVFFRHFNQSIKKPSYVVISKDITQFSLSGRRYWPNLRGPFQGEISRILDIYRPCDNGRYVRVLYPDHLKVGTYTSIITSFRSLVADSYFFGINSLYFVREEDFFYCSVNEYMKRDLKDKDRSHLSRVPLKKVDDGYLFMAAMCKENLKYAVRKEKDFIVNFPYNVWKQ